jgi:hypothetical protein
MSKLLVSFVEGSPGPWGFSASCFLSRKTIRQSQLARAWSRRSRVGDIVIFMYLEQHLAARVPRKQPLGKMCAA